MLSLDLGIPFDELGERMSAATYSLYRDLYSRKPWGDYRADLRMARLATVVANHAGKYRPKGQEAKPEDYLFDFDGTRKHEDEIDLEAMFFPPEKK